MMSVRWCLFGLFCVVLGLAGCGGSGSGPQPVSVAGVITLDGKPLPEAEVSFVSESFSGYGKTDAEGRYELVQGAVPGKNKVVVSKWVGDKTQLGPDQGVDTEQLRAAANAQAESGGRGRAVNIPHETLSPDYSDPGKSKLFFDVPAAGTDRADLRLQSR